MPSHIQLFQSSSFPNSEGTGSVNIGVNLSKQLTLTDQSGNVTIIGGGQGFPYSGSAVITGSLLVSGSGITVTGSLIATNITSSELQVINILAKTPNGDTPPYSEWIMDVPSDVSTFGTPGTYKISLYNEDIQIYISQSGVSVNNIIIDPFKTTFIRPVVAPSITSSLQGTASWASNSISSSFATSASRATTSSYAITASYAMNGGGGGTPGGTAGNIQYKSGSTFGGDPNFNTDGLGGISITGGLAIPNVLSTGNYQLLDSSDVSLNWRGSIAQHIDTVFYFSKKISLTSQRFLAGYTIDNSVPNYEGEIIEGTFNSVSNYQLVFLDTDGDWKPVDQTTDSSTKMLGIVLPGGYVLLEGNIVAHDGGGTNGPPINAIDHGLPVYIKDSTATGLMDTTLPTTSTTYIRRLGHCYYNSTDNASYWIFKFRPSNDWTLVP